MSRKNWFALALVLVLAAGAFWAVQRYRYRFVHSDDDLLHVLPAADDSLFFANVDALRAGGYLGLLAGANAQQDGEYTRFVRETGFDYLRDLDRMAGSAAGDQLVFAARGRFDWGKVRRYVQNHGGVCRGGTCQIATSTPGRWAGLRSLQPDVMLVAISADSAAVNRVQPGQNQEPPASTAPVWLRPSHNALLNPQHLPAALRIFAISLESADSVVLALAPSAAQNAAFAIDIDASFTNQATADTARDQLERSTRMLKLELARAGKPPDPAELTWLLTAGTFSTAERHVTGSWPVRKELLALLR